MANKPPYYPFSSLILAFAFVIGSYLIGNMLTKANAMNRVVTTKGLSEREVKADLAIWPIKITIADNDLKSLNQKITRQKSDVLNFFWVQGFEKEEFSIGTTNITDNLTNPYNQNNWKNYRYLATIDFTLTTSEIDKLKKAVNNSLSLINKGILMSSKNTWRPIVYNYTKLNEIKPEMVEEATKNAKKVAQKFAKDSHSKVGKIKRAQQGLFSISEINESVPEIKKVRVVSTIEFYIED